MCMRLFLWIASPCSSFLVQGNRLIGDEGVSTFRYEETFSFSFLNIYDVYINYQMALKYLNKGVNEFAALGYK